MKLHPRLLPQIEGAIAKSFRDNFVETILKQSAIGDPRLICRAVLRAAYDLAFEKLEPAEATQLLAEALNDLSAEYRSKRSRKG